MVLSHRAVGSMKQNILHKDSEIAFKFLALALIKASLEEGAAMLKQGSS